MIFYEFLHFTKINFSVFRNNNLPRKPDEYNNLVLTWSQFCKETLPDRTFTFWEWFYRILILTSNHMQSLWKEGFVMGFVTKQAAENLLMQKQSGCFLLRFSDSELGGVTIAYVKSDMYRKSDPKTYFELFYYSSLFEQKIPVCTWWRHSPRRI